MGKIIGILLFIIISVSFVRLRQTPEGGAGITGQKKLK